MKYCSYSQKLCKQNIKNFNPISLLPIFVKQFEALIFNDMFNYFSSNKLVSKNYYGKAFDKV